MFSVLQTNEEASLSPSYRVFVQKGSKSAFEGMEGNKASWAIDGLSCSYWGPKKYHEGNKSEWETNIY